MSLLNADEFLQRTRNCVYFCSRGLEDRYYALSENSPNGISLDSLIGSLIPSDKRNRFLQMDDSEILLKYGLGFSTGDSNRVLVFEGDNRKTYMLSPPETKNHTFSIEVEIPIQTPSGYYAIVFAPREFSFVFDFYHEGNEPKMKLTRTLICPEEPMPKSIEKLLERMHAVQIGETRQFFD